MKFRVFPGFLILVSLILANGPIVAQEDLIQEDLIQEDLNRVNTEGLILIDDTQLARVYLQPGVAMSQYNRIYLADAYISFKKDWQRGQEIPDSDRISADDMARIKIELSSLFREVFSQTLEEGGYELVTERSEDVLLIKPSIINLRMVDTDEPSVGNQHSFAESSGEMTLYLELHDSLTDDLIAKAFDRETDRQTRYFQWQNHLTNRAAANRIMQEWAWVLKEGLDAARRSTALQAPRNS